MSIILKSLVIGLVFSFSIFAHADETGGNYYFKGRIYKLSPFVDAPPKSVSKNNTLSDYELKMSLQLNQTPVKNQGNRGSCAYFSATALVESLIKKKVQEDVNISEEYLIYHGKAVHGYYSGGDGSSAYENLRTMRDGFLLERDAPYQPSWFAKGLPCENYKSGSSGVPVYCYAHRKPAPQTMARKISIGNIKRISVSSFSSEFISAMNKYKTAILVGLPVNHKGWDGETGYVHYNEEMRRECQQSPSSCGGHSVLVTGYDIKKEIFYFKNSWGNDWGKSGYGTMPFSYVDKYSSGNSVTAALYGDVNLPSDHDVFPTPKITGVKINVYYGEKLGISLQASVSGIPNMAFYTSTFMAYRIRENEAISDRNSVMLKTPENSYVIGKFFKIAKDNGYLNLTTSNPAMMDIPFSDIDTSQANGGDIFLRVSAYVFDDINGWKKLWRVFDPVDL
ncbi:MAG: C1 family peptidase [Bacteriovoracaceae bacterium]|nr:C1 family peptidase [Bacteriovoracaceae bacterium]